jgi:glycosyltransferase involved in cell wall biosynthesis
MTVQNKVYEGLAMARPVITGDSPAVRQALKDNVNVVLCDRENPLALAQAVRMLKDDPALRIRLSENGYSFFNSQFDLLHIGQRFSSYLNELMA